MLCISCFCYIFRQTSRFGTLHSRPKQRKDVLDFLRNPSWNLLEICRVTFVDTLWMCCWVSDGEVMLCVTWSLVLGWLIWVLRRCRRLLLLCLRRCLLCPPPRLSTRTPACATPLSEVSPPCVSPLRRPASPRSVPPEPWHRLLSWWRRALLPRSSILSISDCRRCASPPSPLLSPSCVAAAGCSVDIHPGLSRRVLCRRAC